MEVLSVAPPAIVREVNVEMDQLAFEATAALDAANKSTISTLERYREAGEALTKAKAKCKHGQWLKWLNDKKISRLDAWRAMRIASGWGKCITVIHLNDALKQLAAEGDESEIPDPDTKPKTLFCERCNRVGPIKDCPACAEARAAARAKPPTAPTPDAPREPGDDTEAEAAAEAKDREDAANNGKPSWTWKSFTEPFGKVVRAVDELKKSVPDAAPKCLEAHKHLKAALTIIKDVRGQQ